MVEEEERRAGELFGVHSPENIALTAFGLGTAFGGSFILSLNYQYYNLALFIASVSLFHFSEYWTTAKYRKRELSLDCKYVIY
jgi:hypothetical protein